MIICIDPGHGGKDPGAVDPTSEHTGDYLHTKEKDLNLAISLFLGDELKKYSKIIYTRFVCKYILLSARANLANINNADIFVSIHNNAANPKARGFQVYYYTGSKEGIQLARSILKNSKKEGIITWDNPIPKKFTVLTKTKMPAVLVECGFITNVKEEKLLNDKAYQKKLAKVICSGIVEYFGFPDSKPVLDVPDPKPVLDVPDPKPVLDVGVLKWGDKNENVKNLQRRLNNMEFPCGQVDGIFGKRTFSALVLFQALRGIKTTGIFDTPTQREINVSGRYRAIRRGDHGKAVKVVQQFLARHGRACSVDGVFGPITDIQVRRFQRDKGSMIDGLVGIKTVKQLLST